MRRCSARLWARRRARPDAELHDGDGTQPEGQRPVVVERDVQQLHQHQSQDAVMGDDDGPGFRRWRVRVGRAARGWARRSPGPGTRPDAPSARSPPRRAPTSARMRPTALAARGGRVGERLAAGCVVMERVGPPRGQLRGPARDDLRLGQPLPVTLGELGQVRVRGQRDMRGARRPDGACRGRGAGQGGVPDADGRARRAAGRAGRLVRAQPGVAPRPRPVPRRGPRAADRSCPGSGPPRPRSSRRGGPGRWSRRWPPLTPGR